MEASCCSSPWDDAEDEHRSCRYNHIYSIDGRVRMLDRLRNVLYIFFIKNNAYNRVSQPISLYLIFGDI